MGGDLGLAGVGDKRFLLQMMTWVYYKSSRQDMVEFAAVNLYNGDRAKAKQMVDAIYPIAEQAIDPSKPRKTPSLKQIPKIIPSIPSPF